MYSTLVSLAIAVPAVSAVYQGFNYGSTFSDGSAKVYNDFKNDFTTAKGLAGTNSGFTSARLYTMIQYGTTNTPITALQAAQDTDTTLLLGMWASGGDADFANEIAALTASIQAFPGLASSIAGISVGSEDLYRISPTGLTSPNAAPGAGPDVIDGYINKTRAAVAGTAWAKVPIGHVDTWNAWTNSTNFPVITNSDFLGVDEYPFYQTTVDNSIGQAKTVFDNAYQATVAVAQGKPVWITESGWPISGSNEGQAIASIPNAKTYWDQVGCPLFGTTNTWWFTLQDAAPTTPNPSFGVIGATLTETPIYDLSCANVTTSSTSSSSSATSTSSSGSAKSSGAVTTGIYSNSTGTSSSGSASSTGSSTSGSGSGSSGSGSGSGSSSGSSGSGSGSGSSSSSAGSSSTSAKPFTGAASNLGSSAVGIFGAILAAVLIL